MSITIHAFPPSPRAFKVMAVAHHVGADCTIAMCDLVKGEQRAEGFAAINPNRKIPVLQEDDFTLWESNAIIEYLAATHPQAGLMPSEPRARADVLRWMFWEATTWGPACATLAFQRLVKPLLGLGGPDPAVVEQGERDFHAAASILDAHLKGRDYLSGDRLTLADFAVGAVLTLAVPAQYPLDPYGEIRRWAAGLAKLPAWRAAFAEHQPSAQAA